MEWDRRKFIKFVVVGSVAACCPIDLALRADCAEVQPMVDGDHFEICHEVREGHSFTAPAPTARHDIAILGGGVSGLTAAYLLRGQDFILLEKEPHWGGNAYLQEYEGQAFSTGAAFTGKDDSASRLSKKIGLEPLPVDSPDGTIVGGIFVPDTWRSGLEHLPYRRAVIDGFRKFRDDMLRIDVKTKAKELDLMPWSHFLRGYPPEVIAWCDGFGRSNWGGSSSETSAMIGVGSIQEIATAGPDDRVTFPGGLGAITHRLAAILSRSHAERMCSGAAAVAVEQGRGYVAVTYVRDGKVQALEAKAVIVALPKFFARRIVAGLPATQSQAMAKIQYAPYAVVNLIFDRPVFNRGYDTWCPGNAFTDFIVADWVIRNQPGYRQRNNILTCYTPLPQTDRAELLSEDRCRQLAAKVLSDFCKLFPKIDASPVEVQLYRRGHPMMISAPGTFTELLPIARQPMGRVFFANTDSQAAVSSTDDAITAAHRAVDQVRHLFAGRNVGNSELTPLASLSLR